MKKIVYLFALLTWGAFAGIAGWLQDYDDALAKSQKTHKPVLMMYSAKD